MKVLFILVCWLCVGTNARFNIDKQLQFLGCIFRSPALNETSSLFPEIAGHVTQTNVMREVGASRRSRDFHAQPHEVKCAMCKRKHNELVGLYQDTCVNEKKLTKLMPYMRKRSKSECKKKHIQVYRVNKKNKQ